MNAKRRENTVCVLPKKRTLTWHKESQRNRNMAAYITAPNHNIQLTTQGMTQTLRIGDHLYHVTDSDDYSPN
ncbi:Phosphoglycerate mutase-like protein AT74 [Glycine max]|nr:Phosphoglycerate mutase-like protein AT74 [Glycine max]